MRVELARRGNRHAACGLGEDAFAFRQESHAVHNLRIGCVLGPAAAAQDRLGRIKAVRRIADGKRARDRRRLLRINLIAPGLYRRADGAAPRGLRAEKFYLLLFHESERRSAL